MSLEQENCIFCKIASGDSPAGKVYEDENTVAFLDIRPVNEGHTLVIPKEHFSRFEETPDDVLANLIKVSKKIGLALEEALDADGFNVIINNKPSAGEIISHTHIHVIPRFDTDGLANWQGSSYKDGEAQRVAEQIRKQIGSS